jgi:hypothetical protein
MGRHADVELQLLVGNFDALVAGRQTWSEELTEASWSLLEEAVHNSLDMDH